MVDIRELVDAKNGTQSRRIFWDREIYELEMQRIFARCWIFLTHESLIPEFGDFVVTRMGEDEVIVWRQRDGSIKAFLNNCTHRGAKLCTAEAGNSRGFSCSYHGWAFAVEGKLASVPCDSAYGPLFDRQEWGLREVPLVQSYQGFVFGCMDAGAPGLKDYLGDIAWYLDIWADVPGGIELVGPPSRSIIQANWKSPTENFIGDTYHVGWTHASVMAAVLGQAPPQTAWMSEDQGFHVTSRYGHGLGVSTAFYGPMMLVESCPELHEALAVRQAQVEQEKGPEAAKLVSGIWDGSLFPNCSYLYGANVLKVWNPMGPDKVEVMTWTIAERNMSDDLKQRLKVATHRYFGTAGMLESDDIDNFDNSANRGYVTRQGRLNCQMGLGQEREDDVFPGVLGDYMSEVAQRGFYRFYADCLASPNWQDLEEATTRWKSDLLDQ